MERFEEATVPTARTGAVLVAHDGRLYVWGGHTQVIEGEGEDRFIVDVELPDPDTGESFMEVMDIETRMWCRFPTRGSVPQVGNGSVIAVVGAKLYLFGGWNDNNFSADIFVFDTASRAWECIETTQGGPVAKYRTGMVAHGTKLYVFGGVGKPFNCTSMRGATFIENRSFSFEFNYGWNNEMHEFDTKTRLWSELQCSGNRPPPIGDFTLNKIDKKRALLFAGRLQQTTYNSYYIVNLETAHWSGPFEPSSPDQAWPAPRCLHSSACLVEPDSEMAALHQQLITFWGKGSDNKHVEDIWILHIASTTWRELKAGAGLMARMWQMTCSHHYGDMRTDVIMFGGNKRRQSKFDKHVMTALTVFRFGIVEDLQSMCMSVICQHWEGFEPLLPQLPPVLQSALRKHRHTLRELFYPVAGDYVACA